MTKGEQGKLLETMKLKLLRNHGRRKPKLQKLSRRAIICIKLTSQRQIRSWQPKHVLLMSCKKISSQKLSTNWVVKRLCEICRDLKDKTRLFVIVN